MSTSPILHPQDLLGHLPEQYRTARHGERRKLVRDLAQSLIHLGDAAHKGEEAALIALREIGRTFEALVLEGTIHQQLACKLAVELGLKRPKDPIPALVSEPLIDALMIVLRVGAPNTRDTAVEGLGALLKDCPGRRRTLLPVAKLTPAEMKQGDERVNSDYFERLERRVRMALAVAGDPTTLSADERSYRGEYLKLIDSSLSAIEKAALESDSISTLSNLSSGLSEEERAAAEKRLENLYYNSADLLRTLTAICRQAEDHPAMVAKSVALLTRAAAGLKAGDQGSIETRTAFARYQESIFHTIRILIQRKPGIGGFDDVVAGAIATIPFTLVGPVPLCNGEVRATVAILLAAAALLAHSDGPKTLAALDPLFKTLAQTESSQWNNPGIVEGCFRGLPQLLTNKEHHGWTAPALQAVFDDLRRERDFNDLVGTHRQMVASICFRQVLLRLAGRLHDHATRSPAGEAQKQRDVEYAIRLLLANPDADHVVQVFQQEVHAPAKGAMPHGLAAQVIAGASLETDLLRESPALFERWSRLPPPQRLLLTRLLAAQLQVLSHDVREVDRYPLLAHIYENESTIALTEADRQRLTWDLLAGLPSEAARAADADLQDFVESCGIRSRGAQKYGSRFDDLPGYVLAMIDDTASERIAAAIAREIDLNRRHAAAEKRKTREDFDFSAVLYQIMVRGPHEAIFNHLYPRIDIGGRDRDTVILFRNHVKDVRADSKIIDRGRIVISNLLDHIETVVEDLKKQTSPTLGLLRKGLGRYQDLAAPDDRFWSAAVAGDATGGLGLLFSELDRLATETNIGRDEGEGTSSKANPNRRAELAQLCKESLVTLKSAVDHYLRASVNDFAERAEALRRARDTAQRIESTLETGAGLQPPEKVLLTALLQHYRDVFDRTIRWFCDKPLACKEKKDYEAFWTLYVEGKWPPMHPGERINRQLAHDQKLLQNVDGFLRTGVVDASVEERLARLMIPGEEPPPEFKGQRSLFEKFAVDWMSSELEVDQLRSALSSRWPPWFRRLYGAMTRMGWMVPIMVAPLVMAWLFDWSGRHAYEGAGFFILGCLIIVMAIASFSHVLNPFHRSKANQYRFECLLPRLARLIAVPIALLGDFEHSYKFPFEGSSLILLLLYVLAFMTTRYFIRREIVERDSATFEPRGTQGSGSGPGQAAPPANLREPRAARALKVRQIHSVALAHAFAIAFLFSMIFGSNHVEAPPHETSSIEAQSPWVLLQARAHAAWSMPWLFAHWDEVTKEDASKCFLGLFPREVEFDLGMVLQQMLHWSPPAIYRPHFVFHYYPTIILSWAAMGLFFGVFLEGFLKGEHVRGEIAKNAGSG